MIYLTLFLTFLKIGAVSFGGGYGMIAIVREAVLSNGWLTESEFLNFIAVAEATPGPIAVNMATFIGSTQGGVVGAILCTLGVVLPSFIIMLLIAAVLRNLLKYAGVNAVLNGIRPSIIGLILATAATMILSTVFGVVAVGNIRAFDYRSLIIFAVIAIIAFVYKRFRKKSLSPIVLILISACLGIIMFGFIK